VISDNASTDGTDDICRHYVARDSRIRYERQERNYGAPWNYNRVFKLSQGAYFKWAAHDDLCTPNFLATCVNVLDLNPSVIWCQTRVGVIDSHGIPVRTQGCDLSGAAEVLTAREDSKFVLADSKAMRFAHQRFRNVLLGNNACFDVYGLIRREALQRISLWKPYFGWEKVLMSALALQGKCAEVPDELFFFRVHEDACSASGTLEEETAWSNPNKSSATFNFVVRFQLLVGHIRNVLEAPIGYWERANCFWGIMSYLLQFQKWLSVIPQIVKNTGIGGSTRETLRKHAEPQFGSSGNPPAFEDITIVANDLERQESRLR
jgi:glycosyltransferase involved in cell wall biosynthesis